MTPTKSDMEIVAAATPGPWEIAKHVPGQFDGIVASHFTKGGMGTYKPLIVRVTLYSKEEIADAEFIAHFNPSKVKEMLDRIAELDKKLKEEKKASDEILDMSNMWLTKYNTAQSKLDAANAKIAELGAELHTVKREYIKLNNNRATKFKLDRAIEVIKDYDGIAGWSAEKGVTKFSSASEFLRFIEDK